MQVSIGRPDRPAGAPADRAGEVLNIRYRARNRGKSFLTSPHDFLTDSWGSYISHTGISHTGLFGRERIVQIMLRRRIIYRRTSISGTKKAQINFPLRHFFPLKVVK
jgi:hypothetical protein